MKQDEVTALFRSSAEFCTCSQLSGGRVHERVHPFSGRTVKGALSMIRDLLIGIVLASVGWLTGVIALISLLVTK